MARYPATSGWRPSGLPPKRFVSPGSATAAWVSQNRIPRTFVRFSIHALRVRMSPDALTVGIVRKDRGRNRHDPGIQDVGVHGGQMTFDRLGPLAGKDVVHSREDDHIGGTRPRRIPKQTGANLLPGLPIHPPLQNDPIVWGPHHPKPGLSLRQSLPLGRSLERR